MASFTLTISCDSEDEFGRIAHKFGGKPENIKPAKEDKPAKEEKKEDKPKNMPLADFKAAVMAADKAGKEEHIVKALEHWGAEKISGIKAADRQDFLDAVNADEFPF